MHFRQSESAYVQVEAEYDDAVTARSAVYSDDGVYPGATLQRAAVEVGWISLHPLLANRPQG